MIIENFRLRFCFAELYLPRAFEVNSIQEDHDSRSVQFVQKFVDFTIRLLPHPAVDLRHHRCRMFGEIDFLHQSLVHVFNIALVAGHQLQVVVDDNGIGGIQNVSVGRTPIIQDFVQEISEGGVHQLVGHIRFVVAQSIPELLKSRKWNKEIEKEEKELIINYRIIDYLMVYYLWFIE